MQYQVIYMDPPWSYGNKRTGGSMKSGAAQQYPTLKIQELRSLPISELADNDCTMFLWATTPLLPEAIDLMRQYGFKYKTAHVWDKERYGLGFNFRVQTEILLVGWRGKWKPLRLKDRNIHREKSTRHSQKPDYYRDMIVRARPEAKRIELFARRPADENWDVWGNEAEGAIDWRKEKDNANNNRTDDDHAGYNSTNHLPDGHRGQDDPRQVRQIQDKHPEPMP